MKPKYPAWRPRATGFRNFQVVHSFRKVGTARRAVRAGSRRKSIYLGWASVLGRRLTLRSATGTPQRGVPTSRDLRKISGIFVLETSRDKPVDRRHAGAADHHDEREADGEQMIFKAF